MNKKSLFLVFLFVILSSVILPVEGKAAALGEAKNFYIDPAYDMRARQDISAQLVLETSRIYFYVDSSLWNGFSTDVKKEMTNNLLTLGNEFNDRIYPILTSNYGYEWNPGIDNDQKITVLFHQLKRGAGGYFNSGNEYSRYEVPVSNEREMVYLNSDYLASALLKRLLTHEFTHLITYNQKEKISGIEEDVWLNEARAEYAITLCGYDNVYSGSNLQKRVVEFLKNPNDSLVDWQGISNDYGVLNIFTQYFVDQYGVKILNDSLNLRNAGIESLNQALRQNGYSDNFSNVFGNWAIAVLLNDCSYGQRYCFKNPNLKNLKVIPTSSNLPSAGKPEIYVNYSAKPLAAHWDKINNARGDLTVDVIGDQNGIFDVKYIICDNMNQCGIAPVAINGGQGGRVFISDFKKEYSALIIVSFAKNANYEGFLNFSLTAKSGQVSDSGEEISQDELEKLFAQIEEIKKLILVIQNQIIELLRARKLL